MRTFFVFLLLLIVGCDQAATGAAGKSSHFPDPLVVVTRNAPTTWYEGREGPEGPEYELVKSFAEYHDISLQFDIADSISDVLNKLKQGQGQIAAAGLTYIDSRVEQGYSFGPEYYQVQQQVVCRRDNGGLPKDVEDLVGKKVKVIANSSYVERLNELQQQTPALAWQEVDDMGTEQLLEQVWLRELDCTVADSNIVSINRRYYPELVVAFPLSEEQSLAWIINDQWTQLKDDIETWLEHIEQTGELASILEKYYGHVELFDYVDMRKFISRIKQRLPKYQADFQQAAEEHGLDWVLVAAQAYQESHWNPRAKSPTGVRGIMMLTLDTAKQMGVESRLDARQSIFGGARYLARMIKRLPKEVEGDDRLWYALAAYNMGMGHLRDARKLAISLGKDPNRWVDLKEVLPLLSQKKYYKSLRYGYARGTEALRYVQRIRDYEHVLLQHVASQ